MEEGRGDVIYVQKGYNIVGYVKHDIYSGYRAIQDDAHMILRNKKTGKLDFTSFPAIFHKRKMGFEFYPTSKKIVIGTFHSHKNSHK